jgi:L-iditol 2-dehydrogenase
MKAVVLENKATLVYQDIPAPQLKPGHVLVQVQAVSICGSDVSRFTKGHRTYPIILGHECAGIVVRVGDNVSHDWIGKRAAVIPLIPDFTCAECARGLYSACQHYSFIGSRQAGGFAEYVAVPEKNVLAVPATLAFDAAALIEPATVARHIVERGNFVQGQTACVLGAGSIGLMCVQWLRILGASLIIAVDVSDENLRAAESLGAQLTLNPKQTDVAAQVRAATGGGVDLAIEAAGATQTLAQTIQVTRPRGNIVCGGNQPLDASLPMQFIEDLMRKELQLHGCFMSYSQPFPGHEWTESLAAVLNGTLDTETMISHRFLLSEAPRIFQELAARKYPYRKIIFSPHTE